MKLVLIAGLILALPAIAVAKTSEQKKKAKAKQHAQNATQLFEAKSYELALVEFKKAYELFPVPGLLFNMGQCNLFLGDHATAIEQFEKFLSLKPDTPYRKDVERLIAEAQGEIEEQRRAEEEEREKELARQRPPPPPPPIEPPPAIVEPPPPAPEEESSPVYASWWFWTIIGGVAVAGGTAIAVVATRDDPTTVLPMGDLGVLDRR
jgi:tetratricopeptide (TPR) repeat protein